MPALTKSVVVRTKRGAPIMEDGKQKTDEKGNALFERVPVMTVEIAVLTTKQAFDADDFALAASPTGNASYENRLRAYALCAVRKIDNEIILPPADLEAYGIIRDKFKPDDISALTFGDIAFRKEVEAADDPLPSPGASPSAPAVLR